MYVIWKMFKMYVFVWSFIIGHVTIDAETAFIGDTIYTVNATDPESSMDDILTFTMSCSPACPQFEMMKSKFVSHPWN